MNPERSRKAECLVLRRLASVGQVHVAEALNVSESTVSRMKEGARQWIDLLDACGLKVVPADMQCYREDSLQAILTLARQRMEQLQTPDQLQWDED